MNASSSGGPVSTAYPSGGRVSPPSGMNLGESLSATVRVRSSQSRVSASRWAAAIPRSSIRGRNPGMCRFEESRSGLVTQSPTGASVLRSMASGSSGTPTLSQLRLHLRRHSLPKAATQVASHRNRHRSGPEWPSLLYRTKQRRPWEDVDLVDDSQSPVSWARGVSAGPVDAPVATSLREKARDDSNG